MSTPLKNAALASIRAMFAEAGVGSHEEGHEEDVGSERVESGGSAFFQRPKTLPLGLPSIDAVLPEGGLPRGAVVEIASACGLGRSTSLALAACAAAQSVARLRSGDSKTVGAWCAFIDPWSTLHAAGALGSGVDLSRLLVVRPPLDALARVAVRVVSSRAFSVVVIDTASLPGASLPEAGSSGAGSSGAGSSGRVDLDRWGTIVRRLALAVERGDTSVLLLTDARARRAMPLPVAMRIELERALVDRPVDGGAAEEAVAERLGPQVTLRIAKERRGRISRPAVVSFERSSFEREAHREVERAPLAIDDVLGDVLEGVRIDGEQMNDVNDIGMQK